MQQYHDDVGSPASCISKYLLPLRASLILQRRRYCRLLLSMMALLGLPLPAAPAAAQGQYVVKAVAELKTRQLPAGPLYWRLENFPTLEQAQTAAGPYRWNPDTVSYDGAPWLAAEIGNRVWLFTLGAKGGKTPGGTLVAEIGPVPTITAPEYLLRVNYGSGAPGSKTPVHSHPGSEAFYVLSGRLGQNTANNGVRYVDAGHTMNGNAADIPMEVFSAGTTDLTALIMFVVDATRPFSVPSKMP